MFKFVVLALDRQEESIGTQKPKIHHIHVYIKIGLCKGARSLRLTIRRATGFVYFNCILATRNDDKACMIDSSGQELRHIVQTLCTGTIGNYDWSD